MIGYFANGGGTAHDGIRIFEIGWCISGTTFFARVTILIGGTAFWTVTFNETIWQEHFFNRIVGLLNRSFLY